MLIEKLDEKRLKVELYLEDMKKLNIQCSSFTAKDEVASRALKMILRNAYEQTGFNIFKTSLTVEIFPMMNDGCLIIFTRNNIKRFKARAMKRNFIFKFSSVNNLLDCLKILLHTECLYDSLVYKLKENFYLVLDNNLRFDKTVSFILSEFSSRQKNISENYLREHGKIVFENFK